MPSNSSRIDTTYDDPRTGERVRIREQETPAQYIDSEYDKQLAPIRHRPQDDYQNGGGRSDLTRGNLQDYDEYASRRRVTREHYVGDRRSPPRRRRSSSRSTNSSPPRRRRSDSRDRRDDRDDRRHRRARSLSANGRPKDSTRDFFDKNFDQGFEGFLTAAAGAGIGAISAHKFGHGDSHGRKGSDRWKTIGGGVAGAAMGNAAGKRWKQYEEDKIGERQGGR